MKKIIISLTVLLSCLTVFGEDTNEWMTLKVTLNQLDEYIQRFKGHSDAFADSLVGPQPQAFIDLQSMMKDNWPVALEYLDQIATNDVQKTVIILAGREISEKNYPEFLERLVTMTEDGKLDWQLLKWASNPSTGSRRNYNMKKTDRVQKINQHINELKPTTPP